MNSSKAIFFRIMLLTGSFIISFMLAELMQQTNSRKNAFYLVSVLSRGAI
jgi:hypothetical protein